MSVYQYARPKEIMERYNLLPEELRNEVIEALELPYPEFVKKYQLRKIKRSYKLPVKGDVFVFQPREGIYFYGIVINDNITNHNGKDQLAVMLFKDKTRKLTDINFCPNYANLLIPPLLITRLYWTTGMFYTVSHIENLEVGITYGFYNMMYHTIVDEYGNKLSEEPEWLGVSGLCTDTGVASYVNRELLIDKSLLDFKED